MRLPERADLARTLSAYGAFGAAAVVRRGDDSKSIERVRRLCETIQDERRDAFVRVLKHLERLAGAGAKGKGAST